jgi:hypothetical protein
MHASSNSRVHREQAAINHGDHTLHMHDFVKDPFVITLPGTSGFDFEPVARHILSVNSELSFDGLHKGIVYLIVRVTLPRPSPAHLRQGGYQYGRQYGMSG